MIYQPNIQRARDQVCNCLKALCKFTVCKVILEQSVLSSDEVFDLSESFSRLSLDEPVSKGSTSDGVIYSVGLGN